MGSLILPSSGPVYADALIFIYTVVSLKNSTINEQTHTISKPLNLLDAGHLPSGSYRGV